MDAISQTLYPDIIAGLWQQTHTQSIRDSVSHTEAHYHEDVAQKPV